MTGAEMVIEALADQGVEHIFGYPGGAVLPIYDALFQQSNRVKHILVRHEQGAVHAAEGYARSTGKVGCVLVTSGPGATNAVTGLTDALMDSIPIVCITGQVPTHLIGNDAFQECDTVGITRPCTKHNYLVKNVNDLARVLHEAFHIAASGRPGPVVVDIPKDIQFAKGTYSQAEGVPAQGLPPAGQGRPGQDQGRGRADAPRQASAVLHRRRRDQFRPRGEPEPARTGQAHRLSDHLDADGARRLRGRRSAMARHARHARHLRSQHVDARLRPDDLHRRALRRPHHRPARCVLARLARRSTSTSIRPRSTRTSRSTCRSSATAPTCSATWCGCGARPRAKPDEKALAHWWKQIDEWRARKSLAYRNSNDIIKPQYAIERLYELTKDRDTYITTEVGQHQMWAAQFYRFEEPNRWMTSGGLGTMGYGLPASVGVQLAHPNSLVIDIAGEASVLMTMQEMSTAAQYRLPIKIFIINNKYMGMVRQWQELLHGGRYAESYMDALPDFVKLADAYHAVGIRCEKPGDLDGAIREMINVKKPVIFDCVVDPNENCFPMIPSGRAHNEMLMSDATVSIEDAITEEGKVMV